MLAPVIRNRIGVRALCQPHIVLSKRFASQKAPRGVPSDQVGLPVRFYIPPSYASYPSILQSPMGWVRLVARRVYNFGRNTAQIGFARFSGGFKPEFLLWKNEAVDIFVKVNKAFAKRKIESVKDTLTIWSRVPLLKRQETLPGSFEFDWKLVKLLNPPKLEVFLPYALPGQPLDKVLIIYKFNSIQRLIKLNKKTQEVSTSDDTIENHLAFVVDLNTNKLKLCGSTFESSVDESIDVVQPKNSGTVMKIQGDIFRVNDNALKESMDLGI
ncbi:Mba1 protein [Saccharomycopsis crataegensis]|uniref:Mba1 protein n=1 Tax=Saccharomycopsis crataegensis TaxID=43959 RepID=A0AAV5QJ17_9ASCO|nr:Mba1 protein [Saccharomycopsis crataegensis]